MCICTSCKFTDSFAGKGFASWPKGDPKGAAKSKAEYAAHWAHCGAEFGRKPAALSGSPFPCRGTPQTDPRIWYHFPGGQIGKARRDQNPAYKSEFYRNDCPGPTDVVSDYVAAFTAANNLT